MHRNFLLGVLVLISTTLLPPLSYAQTIIEDVSYESLNFPNRYIRHKGMLGYVEPLTNTLSKKDATFKIVGGLAGKCVSFESVNHRRHFLRHENFRLKLSMRNNNDQRFLEDATFCMRSGLADQGGVSFESYNHPKHYIRHMNFELWLHRFEDTSQFRKDATFLKAPPGGWKKFGEPRGIPAPN